MHLQSSSWWSSHRPYTRKVICGITLNHHLPSLIRRPFLDIAMYICAILLFDAYDFLWLIGKCGSELWICKIFHLLGSDKTRIVIWWTMLISYFEIRCDMLHMVSCKEGDWWTKGCKFFKQHILTVKCIPHPNPTQLFLWICRLACSCPIIKESSFYVRWTKVIRKSLLQPTWSSGNISIKCKRDESSGSEMWQINFELTD